MRRAHTRHAPTGGAWNPSNFFHHVLLAFAVASASSEIIDGADEYGPLHAAILHGSYADTLAALESGASLTKRDALGYTVLHRVVEEGHEELLSLLLSRGAAKGLATTSEGLPMQQGKSVDSRDNNQATALMHAAGGSHNKMVEILVEAGADLSARDEFGMRPLHYAAEGGHLGTVELLLKLGADPDAMDEVGKTAADVASAWGFPKIAEALGPTVTLAPASPQPTLPQGEAAEPAAPPPPATPTRKSYKMPEALQPEKLEL